MGELLDTSVLIEIFSGNKKILEQLSKYNSTFELPSIVVFELYCGTLKEREEVMLEMMPKVPFDDESAKIAGKFSGT